MELKKLILGQEVFFIGEKLPMVVKALSERFAIVTRDFDKKEDDSLLEEAVENHEYSSKERAFEAYKLEIVYAILDLVYNKKAPNNLVFNIYDYRSQEDIDQCLVDLESGDTELSRRNSIELVFDTVKTFKK